MNNKIGIISILFILSSACVFDNPHIDFYQDDHYNNRLSRLPIKKPYQLISVDCCKETWTLFLPDSIKGDYLKYYSVDSVNFNSGNILIYTDKTNIYTWAVINIDKKTIFMTNEYAAFIDYTSKNGIENKLYYAYAIFDDWRITKKLPWKIN
jgi:hypothetical protein